MFSPLTAWAAAKRTDLGWRILRFRVRVRQLVAVTRTAPLRARILVIAVGIYLVSPLDLIPDMIPGLGLIDNIVVLGGATLILRRWHPATAVALRNLVR